MIQKDSLLVTVQCLTYNHEPYIRQCLEGFLMQQTDFYFEVIVHDDASTDGTANIIREYAEKYPNIIKPILETENQWSKNDGSLERIMKEHTHGKYIALCEGDDYWIDVYKLQKQVDFLETHEEYGLVHTNCMIAYEKKNFILEPFQKEGVPNGNVYKQILERNFISTLTVVYRANLLKYAEQEIGNIRYWDRMMWICFSRYTNFYYLNENTAVYRVLKESMVHSDRKCLLYKLLLGTNDLLKYFDNIRISTEDRHVFLVARSKELLIWCYFARDWKYADDFYKEIRNNGKVSLRDFILYHFVIRTHMPLSMYDCFNVMCKKLKQYKLLGFKNTN